MSKFKVLLLTTLCIPALLYSQTFHAIMFANTKNPTIGLAVEQDFNKMKIEFKSMANFIGYKFSSYEYKDYSFNRQNLEKTINGIKCSPDDIIFFYYSGHGGRSTHEKTEFPQMLLVVDEKQGGSERTDLYPIYNVKERLKAKNPRLTIVMGDLCNSEAGWISPKDLKTDNQPTIKSSGKTQFYKDLFLKIKGDVIAVSSKPKEVSIAYTDGSAFTTTFLVVLQAMVSNNEQADWKNLLDLTQHFTNEFVKNRSTNGQGRQHPIYKINSVPVNSEPVNVDNTAVSDNLEASMTKICNAGNGYKVRINGIKPTLTRYFSSPNAKVEVVGRDGKTIVNTTTAQKYLNYLSIATNMVQVMLIDEKKDSNGMTEYIKVHEMQKK